MKKSVVNHHKTHKSPQWPGAAGTGRRTRAGSPPRCGRGAPAPGDPAAAPGSPLGGGVGELVFAAVRPGFVAACMVEAATRREGRPDTPAGRGGPLVVRARRPGTAIGMRSLPLRERGAACRGRAEAYWGTVLVETDKWNI